MMHDTAEEAEDESILANIYKKKHSKYSTVFCITVQSTERYFKANFRKQTLSPQVEVKSLMKKVSIM